MFDLTTCKTALITGLWNVPSSIGENYQGMAPLPDSIDQRGIPGVHFPIPDRT